MYKRQVDELNSYTGLVGDLIQDGPSLHTLKEIQDRLFTIGSSLATDPGKNVKMARPDLHDTDITFLENEIDRMNDVLPEMRSFILPGGGQAISTAHIARCVCRRAERLCVAMIEEGEAVEALVIQYLNRLSDYFFTLARYIAHLQGVGDVPWVART